MLNSRNLLKTIVFLLPTQLGIHFWPQWSHVFGIRLDYFSPTIYLLDILIVTFVAITFFSQKENAQKEKSLPFSKNTKLLMVVGVAIIIANTYFSTIWQVTLFKWLKVIELIIFAIVVGKVRLLDFDKDVVKPLTMSLLFFGAIGMLQFLLQKTAGLFWIFGERSFSVATPGIALVNFFGQNYMRIYGTFPHPNSLAGFFGVGLILFFIKGEKLFGKAVDKLLFCFLLSVIFLSFSQTVWVALFLVGVIHVFSKKLQGNSKRYFPNFLKIVFVTLAIASLVVFPIVSKRLIGSNNLPLSIRERVELTLVAREKFGSNFLLGAGLGTSPAFTRLLQPTHNIFLLVLTETGAIGFVLSVCFLLYLLPKLKSNLTDNSLLLIFLFVILTGVTDHYWLTLSQNQNLLALVLGLSSVHKKM